MGWVFRRVSPLEPTGFLGDMWLLNPEWLQYWKLKPRQAGWSS